jgi:GNAT superfamily N-acetyltransferase
MVSIRPATAEDTGGIWAILEPVLRAGETYALPRDINTADALAFWCRKDHETFVAVEDARLLGTYFLHANQAGGGDHVANCGYMTAAQAQGRGIARRMLEHSLERARQRGFLAMQFNFVVSSNERAITTWKNYGFQEVGRLPLAFRHPRLGLIDALVFHRML